MRIVRWALLSVVPLSMAVNFGCSSNPPPKDEPAPAPPVAGALNGLQLFDGWINPQSLAAPINSTGWEDSPFISADGKTLYFGYTQIDWWQLAKPTGAGVVMTGPARADAKGAAFDVFEGTIGGGAWTVVDSTVNNPQPDLSEAAQGVNEVGDRMVFVRFDGPGDLYVAKKSGNAWAGIQKLPANVNTACVEDNPTLSGDGTTVWYDSDRQTTGTGCGGARHIWETHDQGGNVWSDPVLVTGGPDDASQLTASQAWVSVDGQWIYWSGFSSSCPASGCIFKAPKSGAGWGTPQVVLAPPASPVAGQPIALGEASMTKDGQYLYFAYIAWAGGTNYDINIGVVSQ